MGFFFCFIFESGEKLAKFTGPIMRRKLRELHPEKTRRIFRIEKM